MITEKKNIDTLYDIIEELEKAEMHQCIFHLKSAEELIECKFMDNQYSLEAMSHVKYVIKAVERNLRTKTIADRKYYGKLIATASNNLKEIHGTLSRNILKSGQ